MSTENTTKAATNVATVSRESEAKVIKKVLPTYKDFFESCSENSSNASGSGMRNVLTEFEKSIAIFIPNFPELESLRARVLSVREAVTTTFSMSSDEIALVKTLSAHIDVIVENLSE